MPPAVWLSVPRIGSVSVRFAEKNVLPVILTRLVRFAVVTTDVRQLLSFVEELPLEQSISCTDERRQVSQLAIQ